MDDQKTMNGHSQTQSPTAGVRRNLADFTHDVLTLGELQWQLFTLDLREGSSRCVLAILILGCALVLALGTVPVLLLGLGWFLISAGGLSQGAAYLAVAFLTVALAGGLGWAGWRMFRNATTLLTRSQSELSENLSWIKQALKGRRPPSGTAFNRMSR